MATSQWSATLPLHLTQAGNALRRSPHARLLRLASGWALVVVGALTTPTPVPLGALLVLAGLCILARESRWLRGTIRHLRGRYPRISLHAHGLRHRLPVFLRRVVETTDPRRRPRFQARGRSANDRSV
jgi:hypothetical protein